MKHFNRNLATMALLTALVLTNSIPALADAVTKTISVTYNNIKIVVDGKAVTPKDGAGKVVEPFIADGTTYLPVRAIAEALGKTVEWDGQTQTVYIGEKPGSAQYMTDICPAYQSKEKYTEYSALKSGGKDSFSMGGVKYMDGCTFKEVYGPWAVYNLNSQYRSLSAIVGHVDGSQVGYHDPANLLIYFDGVLAKTVELNWDMFPAKLELDLTGVNQLKFEIDFLDTWADAYWGVGNPILK